MAMENYAVFFYKKFDNFVTFCESFVKLKSIHTVESIF